MSSDLMEMAGRIRAFMRRSLTGQDAEEDFDRLGLQLFRLQTKSNGAYAKFCGARGDVDRWRDIPAVPTVAFKELEMTSLGAKERAHVFFSSGTTHQERSRHFHSPESMALYEESLWLWFKTNFQRESVESRFVFLTPRAEQAPNSSLVHMFETIARRFDDPTIKRRAPTDAPDQFVGMVDRDGGWGVDLSKVLNFLLAAEGTTTPVAILGTAFSFVHLLDALEKPQTKIRLPENSWVLETGGYKGRTREVPKEELYRLIGERLGIPREKIFGEYGMSELSSQAYSGVDGGFRFPPWARAVLISPATCREAADGERGLIRVYDLANVWSAMAVQTEDIGIKVGDGIRLVGRVAQAEARGCSLMAA